jgi:GABA(A) receptor-associated protein
MNKIFDKEYTDKLLKKYPEKVPVIFLTTSNIQSIDKRKFLIPRDIRISELMYVIRKKINITPEKALFLNINNVMPSSNMLLSEAYELYKEKNGILYLTYSTENTFG